MSGDPEQSDEIVERALAVSGINLPDPEHARRSASFAGKLFDELHEPLALDPDDRDLAVLAALFHDVGYLRGARDHHRKSFDIVRNTLIPDIDDDERLIVACVARYHGRSLPNIEHAGFGEMTPEDQRRVRRLSAIVRLAVALDASHLGLIDDIEVRIDGGVLLLVHASQEPAVERDRLREAAAGFRDLTYLPAHVQIA